MRWFAALALAVFLGSGVRGAPDILDIDRPPISYGTAPVSDPIARLQERLDRGEARLEFDEKHGYLPALLGALKVPVSSQGLVFSRTSFQFRRIGPRTPRAVYFGDDVYVGWVQGGEVVEISAVDPRQGSIFYTLDQRRTEQPKFVRRKAECLQCHASSLTDGVPGHLVRSVYPDSEGQPVLRAGTHRTDHSSPLEERWGGWYVTGTHGDQAHLGNVTVRHPEDPRDMDTASGANLTDLGERITVAPYLAPHSDIVALMVLEHQTRMHNLITRASYEARLAREAQLEINRLLGEAPEHMTPSTRRRYEYAAGPLLKYLLFSGEARLRAPVRGTSGFREEFTRRGRRDGRGRSLRDFDLETRLFQYPCSYLIHSPAFDALPGAVKEILYRRLWEILRGEDRSKDFEHLSAADRAAILEILLETKTDLPDYWRSGSVRRGSF